jgi:pimeloyl-ACP methyl ester carboxylesterase/DNA-binding CsgD family transcriptional regulator
MERQDDFTSLIGSIYATVVDTSDFAELLELADKRLSDDANRSRFDKLRSDFEHHVTKAETLMAALPSVSQTGLDHQDLRPRFSIDLQCRIVAPNLVAQDLLGLRPGQILDSLDLTVDEIGAIRRFLVGESSYAPVFRLPRQDSGKPFLLRCEKCVETEVLQCFGVDVPWHDRAAGAMRGLYGLTRSENAVLGLLVEGHSPQEAASLRSRSVETIRQQIKAIVAKTETAGLQDLLHLSRVVCVTSAQMLVDRHEQVKGCELSLPDGRSMSFLQSGDPNGRPVIFLHGCLGGTHLPRAAETELRKQGLRWIAPARPWHGSSTGWPELLSDPARYGEDLSALTDHLNLSEVILVGYDAGAVLACCAGEALGKRLRHVLALSITPPMRYLRDFATAPTHQRIHALAARTSVPLLRYLAILGDRKLRKDGPGAFAETVFRDAPADLEACRDPEVLDLLWQGHFFHVASGNDSFINDCRLIASDWGNAAKPGTAPLRFLHGAADKIIPLSRAQRFAKEMDSDLTVVKNAGHSLPFSHWSELLDALLEQR